MLRFVFTCRWSGKCYWGVHTEKCNLFSENEVHSETNMVTLSSSESSEVKNKLSSAGFNLIEAAGAGYKILAVITGLANAYVLFKDTTFKWDTCGPQAVLKSTGGNIVNFRNALVNDISEISYSENGSSEMSKMNKCCNNGGLIAYRNPSVLQEIINALTSENVV